MGEMVQFKRFCHGRWERDMVWRYVMIVKNAMKIQALQCGKSTQSDQDIREIRFLECIVLGEHGDFEMNE